MGNETKFVLWHLILVVKNDCTNSNALQRRSTCFRIPRLAVRPITFFSGTLTVSSRVGYDYRMVGFWCCCILFIHGQQKVRNWRRLLWHVWTSFKMTIIDIQLQQSTLKLVPNPRPKHACHTYWRLWNCWRTIRKAPIKIIILAILKVCTVSRTICKKSLHEGLKNLFGKSSCCFQLHIPIFDIG